MDAKEEAWARLERIRGNWDHLRTIDVNDMDWLMSDAVAIEPRIDDFRRNRSELAAKYEMMMNRVIAASCGLWVRRAR